jgi:hypothetical protein
MSFVQTFGSDLVTFVSYSDAATPGELGTYPQVETLIDAPNCHHRPLTFQETIELGYHVATAMWKTTIPIREYSDALRQQIFAVQPDDVIRVNGTQYLIVGGVMPHKDFSGWFKATVLSKKQI